MSFVAAATLLAFVAAVILVAFVPAMPFVPAMSFAAPAAFVAAVALLAFVAAVTLLAFVTAVILVAFVSAMSLALRVGALPVTTVSRVVLSSLGVAHLRLFPRQRLCSLRGTFCVGGVVSVVFVVFVVAPGPGVVGSVVQQIVGSGPVNRVTLVVSVLEEAGVCVVEHVDDVAVP
jgi:hypothetical protein